MRLNATMAAVAAVLSTALPLAAQASAVVTPLADGSAASAAALANALLAPSGKVSLVSGSAQYIGQASASGTFTNGGNGVTGLGIANGVVLTSGDARFIGSSASFPGDDPNKSGTFTSGNFDNTLTANLSGGNALFNSLTTFNTTNASILQFSIVPQANNVALSFVFGSEDYNDVVNSGFPTDVFGIFVNGVNYALVPNTKTPISASTINCGGPTSGPANGVGAQNCALYRDNPPFSDLIDTELDGLTTVLTINIPVLFGQANTIAIGIADTLDSSGDSALMLRSGSLQAVPEPASVALLFVGLAAVTAVSRRGRKSVARRVDPAFSAA